MIFENSKKYQYSSAIISFVQYQKNRVSLELNELKKSNLELFALDPVKIRHKYIHYLGVD